MKPLYEMAVMNVRMKFPDAQDTRIVSGDSRFRETLQSALWEDYGSMVPADELAECKQDFTELWDRTWKPRFVPDLWWIDRERNTIHLFEIEDTHPLPPDKLSALHNYWWDMDAWGWDLTLTVFDRYGLSPRSLSLPDYAFHMLQVLKREKEDASP